MIKYLVIIACTTLSAIGGYFLKKASSSATGVIKLMTDLNLYLGATIYLVATVFTIWLIQITEYSIAVPLQSLTYVWSLFVAHWFLGEKITKKRIIGIILIVAGVLIMATA